MFIWNIVNYFDLWFVYIATSTVVSTLSDYLSDNGIFLIKILNWKQPQKRKMLGCIFSAKRHWTSSSFLNLSGSDLRMNKTCFSLTFSDEQNFCFFLNDLFAFLVIIFRFWSERFLLLNNGLLPISYLVNQFLPSWNVFSLKKRRKSDDLKLQYFKILFIYFCILLSVIPHVFFFLLHFWNPRKNFLHFKQNYFVWLWVPVSINLKPFSCLRKS